ncbi:MAG: hypothetical protein PHX18_06300 [Candidatus Gastranaerophilales bacterium]|nr:hypothetical protein [Candidatus Gastranaerophilales bacterium]
MQRDELLKLLTEMENIVDTMQNNVENKPAINFFAQKLTVLNNTILSKIIKN